MAVKNVLDLYGELLEMVEGFIEEEYEGTSMFDERMAELQPYRDVLALAIELEK